VEAAPSPCCRQFWLRKLQSLTGLIFLGYFLCRHVRGLGAYDTTAVRVLFLYLPLFFHAVYGAALVWESSPNNIRYGGYVRNWMYLMQRVTGGVIFVFLLFHVGSEVWGWSLGAWYPALWYAGLVAAVFHLANGLFGSLIHFGVTVGPHSQRVFVGVSFAAFLVLAAYGVHTLATGGYF